VRASVVVVVIIIERIHQKPLSLLFSLLLTVLRDELHRSPFPSRRELAQELHRGREMQEERRGSGIRWGVVEKRAKDF
jgi:hypothetical protein